MTEETKPKKEQELEKEAVISIAWVVSGVLALIIVVFISVLATKGSINIGGKSLLVSDNKTLTTDTAQDNVTTYINEDILQGQTTAEIKDFEKSNGLYKFKVAVEGEEFDSYMTVDGKLLFPSPAVEMTDETEEDTATEDTADAGTTEITKAEKATAYLFTMSYCPYGNQAEDAIMPVVDLLGDKATIEPHYVIYSDYNGGGSEYCLDDENKYCSMHGIQELNQNVRELCAFKYDGADKYWEFVDLANKNCTAQDVDECWEAQGTAAGLDVAGIKTCEANEALDLLATEVELGEKYSVTGSPALVINGTKYAGSRTADGYKTGICSGFTEEPEECATTLEEEAAAATDASCE